MVIINIAGLNGNLFNIDTNGRMNFLKQNHYSLTDLKKDTCRHLKKQNGKIII